LTENTIDRKFANAISKKACILAWLT